MNYTIIYDIKVYDIEMNSNQISNDYNIFKITCISTTKSTSTSTSTSSLPSSGRTAANVNAIDIGTTAISNAGRMIGSCSDLSSIDSTGFETSVCFINI
jgi:hypothetical protein